MKIAYLTSMYPDVSHMFILREVQAVRARGIDVATFSIRRPGDRNALGTLAKQEAACTRWLVPVRAGCLASTIVWALATRPMLTCRTLLEAALKRSMTVGQRFKWLCYFGEAVILAHWLVAESFDHLHCHFGNNGSSTGMLAARLAGIPFSMTCHGSELLETKRHRLVEKVVQADFVACVSNYGRAQLMLACQPDQWGRLHVVRCGIPEPGEFPGSQNGGPPQILCVAHLSPEKGHLVLLDALARLRDESVGFRCTLVGDGPMRSTIETRAAKLRLTGLLTLTGSLEPDRVAQLYSLADVTVLASFSEGVPVTLMEAMARGRPVVATRVGGVPELVEDGCSGLVVAPGDPDALAEALLRILEDTQFAGTLGQNGARKVREEFSIETAADQLAELFHRAQRSRAERGIIPIREQTSCPPQLTPQDS